MAIMNDTITVKLDPEVIKKIDQLAENISRAYKDKHSDVLDSREVRKLDPCFRSGSFDADAIYHQLFDAVRNRDHETCGKPLEDYVPAWRDRIVAYGRKITDLLEAEHARKTRVLQTELDTLRRGKKPEPEKHLATADEKQTRPPIYGELPEEEFRG